MAKGNPAGAVVGVALIVAGGYWLYKKAQSGASSNASASAAFGAALNTALNSGHVATVFNAPGDMLIPGPDGAVLFRGTVDPVVDDLSGKTIQ